MIDSKELSFKAVVFDLDGVITQTAAVHAMAWKAMFDEYLKKVSEKNDTPFKEFTHQDDYLPYVDGKPRYDGVKSFLESRGISIEFGDPADSDTEETVCGLGNRKNTKFMEILHTDGVKTYPTTVDLIKELKDKGIHIGVASSSKNCEFVLENVGLTEFFETRVDGAVSAEIGLNGKPAPDIFIKATENMGCIPKDTIVVEDAASGVEAGSNGNFGLVIGLARENNEEELKKHGADVVYKDFNETSLEKIEELFCQKQN